jgi:hypothetical protein
MAHRTGIARLIRSSAKRAKIALLSMGASIHPHPLLVLGNQKSGTTAVAALLAEMVDLPVSLDLQREILHPEIQRVRRGELSFERYVRKNRLDFSRDIIKEPSLTLCYDELAAYFPESRFVMVIRDPRENLRSILQRLRLPGNLERLDEGAMGALPAAWRLVLDGRWLGLRGDNYIEMLAARWNYTTDLYLRHAERTTLVKFEDFLEDKVGEIRSLAATLGLEERRDITSKVDKPFQPPGDRTVRWPEFFGDNLPRIEKICGERMKRFDYAPSS